MEMPSFRKNIFMHIYKILQVLHKSVLEMQLLKNQRPCSKNMYMPNCAFRLFIYEAPGLFTLQTTAVHTFFFSFLLSVWCFAVLLYRLFYKVSSRECLVTALKCLITVIVLYVPTQCPESIFAVPVLILD